MLLEAGVTRKQKAVTCDGMVFSLREAGSISFPLSSPGPAFKALHRVVMVQLSGLAAHLALCMELGVTAAYGYTSAASLMSLTDLLFHPNPWTIAVPVLTDFMFPVDKRKPLLLACKDCAMAQPQLLSIMWGYLQIPKQSAFSTCIPLSPISV